MASQSLASSNSKIMDLTPWDLHLLQIEPIQIGLLFKNPIESCNFEKNIIHHLKTSLSHTLDFFPPLTGRLNSVTNTDNTISYFVNCNNVGVEFVHAIAGSVSISDILEPTYVPNEIISSFFTLNEILLNYQGVSKPLLGVQVTELVDGFFIGLTANHAIMDGTSFSHFVQSWSEISRGLDTISKIPVFERWFPSNIGTMYNNNRLISLPPPDQNLSHHRQLVPPPNTLFVRVFHFSKENLAKLKSKANSEAARDRGTTDRDKISTVQALSAHLWRSVARCCREQNKSNLQNQQVYNFITVVDTRKRIPLPDGYFGNAIYGVTTTSTEHELLNNGLGHVALKLHESVNKQTAEVAIKFVEDWVNNPMVINSKWINTLVLNGSPRYNAYGIDFGWGKPVAIRGGKGHVNGKLLISPAAECDGSIDVEVCLERPTLEAMERDTEFMEAVTHLQVKFIFGKL